MRRYFESADIVLTRFVWTVIGLSVGGTLGVGLVDWILGWTHGFLVIFLTTIAGGGLGLRRDITLAKRWKHFEDPNKGRTNVPNRRQG